MKIKQSDIIHLTTENNALEKRWRNVVFVRNNIYSQIYVNCFRNPLFLRVIITFAKIICITYESIYVVLHLYISPLPPLPLSLSPL